ncbi:MAG: hypothetical protein JOZ48_09415 [Acidobacteriaceae bacterium]|nr:hypothetical protein [Acidobacteriaceae bacterium]
MRTPGVPAIVSLLLSLCLCGLPASSQTGRRFDVRSYGARGDYHFVDDGTIQAGTRVLTSPSANFTSADVRKPLYILGAGPLVNGRADPLSTTIVSIENGANAVLAYAAQTTVTNGRVSWGSDDRIPIERAINAAAAAGGGNVYVPAGTFGITGALTMVGSNIHLTGEGNNTVLYQSKVYASSDGPAVNQTDGLPVLLIGVRGTRTSNIEIDHLRLTNAGTEIHNSVNGNGIITFVDGAIADNYKLHDLRVETSSRCGINSGAISNGYEIYENYVEGGLHGFYIAGDGTNGYIHDNHLVNTRYLRHQFNSEGIAIKNQKNCRIIHNTVEGYRWGILIPDWPSKHVSVDNNTVTVSSEAGNVLGIAGNNGSEIVISNNQVECQSRGMGLWFYTNRLSNIEATRNTIKNCLTGIKFDGTATGTGPANLKLKENAISGCTDGIRMESVGGVNVVQTNKQTGCSGMPWLVTSSPNGTVTYFSQDNTFENTARPKSSFDGSVRQVQKSEIPPR